MMISVPVSEQNEVAQARRAALEIAQRAGFDETAVGRVAIAATEMATNLIKHGKGGYLLIDLTDWPEDVGTAWSGPPDVELIAIDKGPGLASIETALQDGYSTAGSAGHGLGAIRRQAHSFNVYSRPGAGTVLAVRLGGGPATSRKRADVPSHRVARGLIGSVCLAKPGEDVCGDGWHVIPGPGVQGRRAVMVVDGLGHGPQAAEASAAAVRLFNRHAGRSPAEIMEAMHEGLRPTRGAAVSIARFEPERRMVSFCGIGNVGGVLASRNTPEARRMLSLNGTVGHVMRKVQQFDYPYPAGGAPVVILHSDGISAQWALDKYPGLSSANPSLLAAVLYRDFGRDRDDATVLVAHDLGEEH
ncbi:ATP-binding protein [Labrys okinawensis]|uniref:ATP-binding protein n=1 Tax=Labrys okinawensis TaxID=346911 RepID=UPI0039BD4D1E